MHLIINVLILFPRTAYENIPVVRVSKPGNYIQYTQITYRGKLSKYFPYKSIQSLLRNIFDRMHKFQSRHLAVHVGGY